MTLAEARADLIAQDDYDPSLYLGREYDAEGNQVEEAVGLTRLISHACQWWASLTFCNFNPKIALTLTIGEDKYDCRDRDLVGAKVLRPKLVIINDTVLYRRDRRRYGLWTLDELEHERSNWRLSDDGTPDIAVWLPSNELLLSVPPSAIYTGKNFIAGWTIPDALVAGSGDDTQLPIMAEEDHPAIVRLALDYGSTPTTEQSKGPRMFKNENFWREQAQRKAQKNMGAVLGRKPRGSRASEWLY